MTRAAITSLIGELTRCCIGQTLADDPLQSNYGALAIVHTVCNPIVIPELIFRQIAVQMLLATVLISGTNDDVRELQRPYPAYAMTLHGPAFATRGNARPSNQAIGGRLRERRP